MANEIPVYLFTGFMDSGKTSLIKDTLGDRDFSGSFEAPLIICCEDGDVEYDEADLRKWRANIEYITEEDDFAFPTLEALDRKYNPDAVFIEYNGTWEVGPLFDDMQWPRYWEIVQTLATVDADTFEMYLLNMRTMMMEQLFKAEVVIFNRCDDNTNRRKFRANVKSFNRPAQIVYERKDGTIDEREEELPFDLNADVIEISDADYALWFMDCMDNPKKYNGKKVHFLGLVYNPNDGKLKKGVFVPGRFAMTCCVEDIQFLGMVCRSPEAEKYGHRSWVDLTATIRVEFCKEYRGKGPVLYPESVVPAQAPATQEEQLVYFS